MNDEKQFIKGIVAAVAVDKTLLSYDKLFEYQVPDDMTETAEVGKRVVVPFGRGNRKHVGIIFGIREIEYQPDKIKRLSKIIDDGIVLSKEMLYIVNWLKENTFCTFFDAVRTVLPTGLSINLSEKYILNKDISDIELSESENALVLVLQRTKSKREFDAIIDAQDTSEKQRLVKSLIEKGVIHTVDEIKHKVGDETIRMVKISENFKENENEYKVTSRQRKILNFLEDAGSASVKETCYNCSVTAQSLKTMIKNGILEEYEYEVYRTDSSYAVVTEKLDEIVFSQKQQAIFDGLYTLLKDKEPKCALLRGVTGSGKTSIFIKLIEKALEDGKTAMMLVPEIALTPQMVGKFQSLFGNLVAIIHSNLSLGQRIDEYKRIKRGEAKIVVGTRSAVFAPLENIGIIVIDEEGESSYKSEKSPRYHARDIAKQRCFKHDAFLLLASATPSIESYYYAKTGRYSLFEIDERYNNAVLPDVYMIDMKIEAENGNKSNFSTVLVEEIRQNLLKQEQSILLLNRRGYHTHINCGSCGNVIECPNCNLPLTFHKVNYSAICHYCGFSKKMSENCEKCGGKNIFHSGTGTQRIEDEVSQLFPKARVLRMDADTTLSKNAFETKLSSFGRGEYDIMVGTQMIAKGLDFPNVTLVGVLQTDKALYAGDYKGYERTFSLITQVVGRSGRGDKKGRAYIQSYSPEHYVLNLAANQNYVDFYEEEIEIREALIFPPFCDICVIVFSSLIEFQCENAAKIFVGLINKGVEQTDKKIPLRILGPVKSTHGKIGGKFRYRVILKCKNSKEIRGIINDTLVQSNIMREFSNVSVYADMNGEIGL